MESLLLSTGLVALAEIGDKTQLLTLLLVTRFRRPGTVVAGILVATLLNHALAGALGHWFMQVVGEARLKWLLAAGFVAMGLWMLVPDKLDENEVPKPRGRWGVFGTTALAFFAAEMGDKTQIATVALAARFPELGAVVVGTTAGMLLANVPVAVWGPRLMQRIPLHWVRRLAAALFVGLGAMVALSAL
ncbi:TMEM165/GDT1 family protein [Aquabacterium sp. J223]|uniref:TMEM165/GDT1 family protein n=1 Tax=Aquabacterium sp. J223 TaxID=2898431 RepID=UPI0021AE279E|nr:TMEM165/GDT1 family protein [Aquabacterium sp. J223]UUX97885.1 TMEM165/GDT1 family protein [Aquabacterium sp. J223]